MVRVGSLCSGMESLGLGVCAAFGWDPWQSIVWHADNDKAASKVLAHRFPNVPNLGDITAVDWVTVPLVEVLIGGTPCVDLSTAGGRAGLGAGTRSGNLWIAMREAIAVLKPRMVIWENVAGALSADADSEMEPCAGCVGDGTGEPVLRALGRVVGDLSTLGYDCRWTTVPASAVGACHKRERVFLVASRQDARDTDRGYRDGWPTAGQQGEKGSTAGSTADAHYHSTWPGRELGHPNGSGTELAQRGLAAADATVPEWGTPQREHLGAGSERTAESGERTGAGADGRGATSVAANLRHNGSGRTWTGGGGLTDSRIADADTDQSGLEGWGLPERGRGGQRTAREGGLVDWGQYRPAVERWGAVLGRPAPNPITTGVKGGQQLSGRLTEWMMGLPEGWVTDVPGISNNDAIRLSGNGVVPHQCAYALRLLTEVVSE